MPLVHLSHPVILAVISAEIREHAEMNEKKFANEDISEEIVTRAKSTQEQKTRHIRPYLRRLGDFSWIWDHVRIINF